MFNTNEIAALNTEQELFVPSAKRIRSKGVHVYLVEDDLDDRAFAEHQFLKSDMVEKITTFHSAEHLFQYLNAEGAFDEDLSCNKNIIIVLDVHMPYMDGIEALGRIRMHPLTEDLPVAILTQDMSSDLALQAYKHKANAFLQKPLELSHFHDVMDAEWERSMKSR